MVVLSVGMRKAGTGWYFNMTNDLLQAAGGRDARQVQKMPGLRSVIRGNNCTIGRLRLSKLVRLTLQAGGQPFAVKTHSGPAPSLRLFTATGLAKVTYLYRDPRDVVLSALDHGKAAREAGVRTDLVRLKNLDDSVGMVKRELARWDGWMQYPHVLRVRYEDLVADVTGELHRLADFLSLDVTDAALETVAARYRKENYAKTLKEPIIRNPLHLNRGVPGRFRAEMNPEARALCERHFGAYLEKMGYG